MGLNVSYGAEHLSLFFAKQEEAGPAQQSGGDAAGENICKGQHRAWHGISLQTMVGPPSPQLPAHPRLVFPPVPGCLSQTAFTYTFQLYFYPSHLPLAVETWKARPCHLLSIILNP